MQETGAFPAGQSWGQADHSFPGEAVYGPEFKDGLAVRHPDLFAVHLHEGAGPVDSQAARMSQASEVWSGRLALQCWLSQQTAVLQPPDYAIDALGRDAGPLFPDADRGTRSFSRSQYGFSSRSSRIRWSTPGRRLRLPYPPGPPAAVLKAAGTVLRIAVSPPTDRIRAKAEVPCCQPDLPVVPRVPLDDRHSALGFRAGLCREPRQTRRPRQHRPV